LAQHQMNYPQGDLFDGGSAPAWRWAKPHSARRCYLTKPLPIDAIDVLAEQDLKRSLGYRACANCNLILTDNPLNNGLSD